MISALIQICADQRRKLVFYFALQSGFCCWRRRQLLRCQNVNITLCLLSLSLSLSLSFSVFDSWCYKTFLEEILKICISPFAKTTRIGNLKTNEQCLSIDLLKMAKNCFHIFVQVQTSGQTFVNSLILRKSRFTPKNVF